MFDETIVEYQALCFSTETNHYFQTSAYFTSLDEAQKAARPAVRVERLVEETRRARRRPAEIVSELDTDDGFIARIRELERDRACLRHALAAIRAATHNAGVASGAAPGEIADAVRQCIDERRDALTRLYRTLFQCHAGPEGLDADTIAETICNHAREWQAKARAYDAALAFLRKTLL